MPDKPQAKYRPYPTVALPDRRWPERQLRRAPLWCSVDLRDGNQALPTPMDLERKGRLFEALVRCGFKDIEVGFPAASRPDFDFVRTLIEHNRIPDDVRIAVLTQARPELIARTFEALAGVGQATVHLYNSTSTNQRRVVFGTDQQGVLDIAVQGARCVREHAQRLTGSDIRFQYSPESFTGTELEFSKRVCDAVVDVFRPTPERKVVLNFPATVELSMPNVFADRIEWLDRNLERRDAVTLSVHPHNDRGTAVAAAELACLAGAERVEGTLFGNGERTGNVDLVTLALNLHTQGVDPQVDVRDLPTLVSLFERCTGLSVPPRHPYAGELVFTAFSGSHQDAIRKGLAARARQQDSRWDVPYLPIDPADVCRQYEPIVRVNSQSGKAGAAFVVECELGVQLTRAQSVELGARAQRLAEAKGAELTVQEVVGAYQDMCGDAAAQ